MFSFRWPLDAWITERKTELSCCSLKCEANDGEVHPFLENAMSFNQKSAKKKKNLRMLRFFYKTRRYSQILTVLSNGYLIPYSITKI